MTPSDYSELPHQHVVAANHVDYASATRNPTG